MMYRHFPQVGATDFAWAGPGRSTDQRNKFRMVYDECRVNGVTIQTGDFVLLESDGDDCVCQVIELFDPGYESDDKSPSATVQWYWQLEEFKTEKRLRRKIESMERKPHPKEVYLDASNMIKEKRIELETIKDKCYIIGFDSEADFTDSSFHLTKEAADMLNMSVDAISHPVFPCRFRRTNEGILPLYTGNVYNDEVFRLPPLNKTDNAKLLLDRRATPQRETPTRRRRRSATPSRGTTPSKAEGTPTLQTPTRRQTPSRRAAAESESESTTPKATESTSKRATPRSASTTTRGNTPSRSRASPRVLSKAFDAVEDESKSTKTSPGKASTSAAPKILSTSEMTATMMDRMKLSSRSRSSIGRKSIAGKEDPDETIPYKSSSSSTLPSLKPARLSMAGGRALAGPKVDTGKMVPLKSSSSSSAPVGPPLKGRKLTLGSGSSGFTPLPSITLVKDNNKSTANVPFFTRKVDAQNCFATRKLHASSHSQSKTPPSSAKMRGGASSVKSPPTIVSPGRKLDLSGVKPTQKFKADSVVDHFMSDSDEENNNEAEGVKRAAKKCEEEDFLGQPISCLQELQNKAEAKADKRSKAPSDINAESPRSQRSTARIVKTESRSSAAPLVASHMKLGDMKEIDDLIDSVFDSPIEEKVTARKAVTPSKRGRPPSKKVAASETETTPTKKSKGRKSVSVPTTPAQRVVAPKEPMTPPGRLTPRGKMTPSRRLAAVAAEAASEAVAVVEDGTPEKRGYRKKHDAAGDASPDKRVLDTPTRSRRNAAAAALTYEELTPSPVKRPYLGAAADEVTPTKVTKRETPSKRGRKSVAASPAKAAGLVTPKRGANPPTPKRGANPPTPKRGANPPTPSRKAPMTPGTKARTTSVVAPGNQLEAARARLHVGAVPDSLPCRDNEFTSIFNFVKGNLTEGIGGCMYVSGVPGTGKTATVREVMRCMEEEKDAGRIKEFRFIDINGMRLTDPRQAYVAIYKELVNEKATADHACNLLDKRFSTSGPRRQATVLLVDELDLLMTPKQDVLYNIFDWPSRQQAKLTVLAIANTMDLPERVLMNRVSSRLGLTRLIFQPYTFKQLQEIVVSRTTGLKCFSEEAIQFAARKVAAVSGDARRALDICRRATEIAERETTNTKKVLVSMGHVQRALDEMYSSPLIVAIKNCSVHEQNLLRAIVAEFRERGVEDALFHKVYDQHVALCRFEGIPIPTMSEFCSVCNHLNDCRLLLLEPGKLDLYRRVRLNISIDDVNFALRDVDYNLSL